MERWKFNILLNRAYARSCVCWAAVERGERVGRLDWIWRRRREEEAEAEGREKLTQCESGIQQINCENILFEKNQQHFPLKN